jgi:hypothetical protein
MGTMTLAEVFSFLKDAGLLGALLFALVGGYKRVWVWGYQLDECKQREEAWQRLALKNAGLADKTLEMASKP